MSFQHDASYKHVFALPEAVHHLLLGFVPDEWLQRLDFGTLERLSCNFTTDRLRKRESDMAWRIKADGEWLYLYVLIEFQSSVDQYMAVRMSNYVHLLYLDMIDGDQVVNGMLPPILPIVLYNGGRKWTARTETAQLIPLAPGITGMLRPSMKYFVLDLGQIPLSELTDTENLITCMALFERPANEADLVRLVGEIKGWLGSNQRVRRRFLMWMRAVLSRHQGHDLVFSKLQSLEEVEMSLAERINEWGAKREHKGYAKGVRRLLEKRFGPLAPDVDQRIDDATDYELDTWMDRVSHVSDVDEVFLV